MGISKTSSPGAVILATPLIATITTGRGIPGTILPLLLVADFFALSWYRHHARWDLLVPLARWVGLGFVAGIGYFVLAGDDDRLLTLSIGVIVLIVVVLQAVRLTRTADQPAPSSTPTRTSAYGTAGGFTTFVANSAGPIFNAFLVSAGVDKASFIGTSAWFYFVVNISKVPLYLALGEWTDGGRFFTGESLLFALIVAPMVVIGAYVGRALFDRIPQRIFVWLVLVFAALGAINLIVG